MKEFAQAYANQIRRQRLKPADKYHLNEVVIKIKGTKYYLRRVVDKYGQVIDILMQRRRNKATADKFFRKLLKPQQCSPRVLITNKLKSYNAAKKKILKGEDHRQIRVRITELRIPIDRQGSERGGWGGSNL